MMRASFDAEIFAVQKADLAPRDPIAETVLHFLESND